MKLTKIYCAFGLVLIASACATPRERCISNVSKDYNALISAISETKGNISRGYAIHKQTVPYTYSGMCYYGTISYACPKTGYRTQETPVAVNVAEERRRLATLESQVSKQRDIAQKGILQCQTIHPK